jgi:chromosome transmission fidelity protein 1
MRNLLPICDVICLPYSSILSPEVRMFLGININNAVIIFDEAHNAIEQELGMKSPEISYK